MRLLITGDDGYKSVGINLLAKIFKDSYEVTIVGTKNPKSGAGGSTKAYGEKQWGHEIINGIDAYWVDGTPADAMEFAQGKFPNGFDFLISGINWGENIGLSLLTASGTGGAAIRALGLGIVKNVVIMSWMLDSKESTGVNPYDFDINYDMIDTFVDYPGESARYIFEKIIQNNFFNKKIINVNFPIQPTREYKITKLSENLTKFYKYPVIIKDDIYSYDKEIYAYTQKEKEDIDYDIGALISGYISITPFSFQ
jgi:5'/3'-nucleotidase SurE